MDGVPLRVIRDGRAAGSENMARDMELLQAAEPVVRLYGWEPGCVSLGYTQVLEDAVDVDVVRSEGLDHVERPTGGGAIYHDPTEVTYAVVLPNDWPGLPADLFGSYRYLADGVLHALRGLGVDARYREARGGKDAFCYMRAAGVSITVDGRKLSGGAQRRTREAVLQHGTVIVERDAKLLGRLFSKSQAEIEASVSSLRSLDVAVSRADLVDALERSFVECLTDQSQRLRA